jgi:hypothetical protein
MAWHLLSVIDRLPIKNRRIFLAVAPNLYGIRVVTEVEKKQ